MTIPPELAALQRYDVGHDGQFRKSMSGQVLMYDDTSVAWSQREAALRECLTECANRLSDFIIRYDNAQPADPHEIGLLHRHFAEARQAMNSARTLLAGEGA